MGASFSPVQLYLPTGRNLAIAASATGTIFNGSVVDPEQEVTSFGTEDVDTTSKLLLRVKVIDDPNGNANVKYIPDIRPLRPNSNFNTPMFLPETWYKLGRCKIAAMRLMSFTALDGGAETTCETLTTDNRLKIADTSSFTVGDIISVSNVGSGGTWTGGLIINTLYEVASIVTNSYITLKDQKGDALTFTHADRVGVKIINMGDETKLVKFPSGTNISTFSRTSHGLSNGDIVILGYGTSGSNQFGAALGTSGYSNFKQFNQYKVVGASTHTFQLAAIDGSVAKVFTSAGAIGDYTRFVSISSTVSVASMCTDLCIAPLNLTKNLSTIPDPLPVATVPTYAWFELFPPGDTSYEPSTRYAIRILSNFARLGVFVSLSGAAAGPSGSGGTGQTGVGGAG